MNLYCTGPMDFPMQPVQFQQIKLFINSGTIGDKIEDWQSIHMYTYITPTVYDGQFEATRGRRVSLSWREIGKSNFRKVMQCDVMPCNVMSCNIVQCDVL